MIHIVMYISLGCCRGGLDVGYDGYSAEYGGGK